MDTLSEESVLSATDVESAEDARSARGPLITLAKSEDDFKEVSRFWYRIYCVNRGVLRAYADHDKKTLDDALMRKGDLFVARRNGQIVGTVLSTYARIATLGAYEDFYELEKLSEYPNSVGITTKFMVDPKYQKSQLAIRLLQATFRKGLEDNISHAIFDCNEPLDMMFGDLGCRDHVGWKEHPDFGRVRVMMIRLSDDASQFAAVDNVLSDCYKNLHTKQWS